MSHVSHDGMPDGSQPAEADCPIIFEVPDGNDPAEEEQAMQRWQEEEEEEEEEMEIEPPDVVTVSGVCCDQRLRIIIFQLSL